MNDRPKRLRAARVLRWLATAAVLVLAARAGLTLAREPCVGVADNVDYWRVARPAGIEVEPQARKGFYVVCRYPVGEAEPLGSVTSAGMIAWAARPAAIGPDGQFDLRRLGLIYWSVSVAILVAGLIAGVDALLVLIVGWVLYDPGYYLWFNSLYADPALIVGLAAALIVLLLDPLTALRLAGRGRRDGILLAVLASAAAVAGFSKMQYSPFPGVLLGCCALALAFRGSRPRRGQGVLLAALAAIAALAPLHFLHGPAPRFVDANNYNAVFGGIVEVSSDPAAALEALGLPAEPRPGDFFAARRSGDLAPVLPRLRQLSRLRLAALYLGDPRALWRSATAIHAQLTKVRTHPRGNYTEPESGRGPRFLVASERFSVWRTRLLGGVPLWSHPWLIATSLFLALRAASGRWCGLDTGFLLLVLWSASQLAVAVLGEGFVNLHQHLLGARLAIDLLVGLTIARLGLWTARSLISRADVPAGGPSPG